MKSGADVESHSYSVKLGHHGVFKTRSQQLLTSAEDFGSDESGYIIPNHPASCPLTNESGNAVRSRFERNHIDVLGSLIGNRGTLTCLEVKPVKSTRQCE